MTSRTRVEQRRVVAAIVFVVASATQGSVAQSATSAPATSRELEMAIGHLGDADANARRAAAEEIAATPADALPSLEARLLRPQVAGLGPIWLALDKARKGGGTETPRTLLERVVAAGTSPGHQSLALLLAGASACERTATTAGARVLVRMAGQHKGLLKTLVTGSLKRMGDRGIAALLEVRRDADRDVRAWANKTLDALGKFMPSDAVQVRDSAALPEILTALGESKDPDAVRAVLPYVSSDRSQVRDAARWAIAQFGPEARTALKETYDGVTGEHAGEDWSAEQTLKALVTALDKVRLAEVFRLFDEGVAHRNAGRLEAAVASFDALLARAPTFERRSELAPAYVELAHHRERTDRPGAHALLAKAGRLAGTGTGGSVGASASAASIESELLYLDALDLYERGVVDRALFRRALSLDNANARARALLDQIEREASAADDRLRRAAAAGAAAILATIGATLLFGRHRSAPRRGPRRPIPI